MLTLARGEAEPDAGGDERKRDDAFEGVLESRAHEDGERRRDDHEAERQRLRRTTGQVTAQHDDEVTVAYGEFAGVGALKLFVFGRLKNSARKERTDSPGSEKFLNTDASY